MSIQEYQITRRDINEILFAVQNELLKAIDRFPKFHSAHEGFAILKEEVDELWEAIKEKQGDSDRNKHIIMEAVQVSAMAIRLIIDMRYFKN